MGDKRCEIWNVRCGIGDVGCEIRNVRGYDMWDVLLRSKQLNQMHVTESINRLFYRCTYWICLFSED